MRSTILLSIFIICSCNSHKIDKCFESIELNDVKLSPPVEGEWLFTRKEKGQTLSQFENSNHVKRTNTLNTIYLLPIGEFDSLQFRQLELTREYLRIFYQLDAKTLPPIPNDSISPSAKRFTYNEQLLAGYILDSILKDRIPKNGIVMMGITQLDLYPKEEWNYVFGLASYTNKVSVCSIYRFQEDILTDSNFNLCLSRLLKVSSHEMGHSFGLHHCINAKCVMNGSNNLPELDKSPTRMCSLCQRKIQTSLDFDANKRNKELTTFFKNNNLLKEMDLVANDLCKK